MPSSSGRKRHEHLHSACARVVAPRVHDRPGRDRCDGRGWPCHHQRRSGASRRLFHYDVAQAAHPGALTSLTRLVQVSQILFGTDFPYRTTLDHVKGLESFSAPSAFPTFKPSIATTP